MTVVSSEQQTWASASAPTVTEETLPSTLTVNAAHGKKRQHVSRALTLQSLEGTVLLEFLFMKPSMQCWNFFLTKESSSQLHSEYGRPIHLQRYSGSLEDVFL